MRPKHDLRLHVSAYPQIGLPVLGLPCSLAPSPEERLHAVLQPNEIGIGADVFKHLDWGIDLAHSQDEDEPVRGLGEVVEV